MHQRVYASKSNECNAQVSVSVDRVSLLICGILSNDVIGEVYETCWSEMDVAGHQDTPGDK